MTPGWNIIEGDCRDVLATLPETSIHTCVTSPPYFGLRDYGHPEQIGLEPTPEEFVAALVAAFREVRRVLRDDGTVWVNLGDTYNAYDGNRGAGKQLNGLADAQRNRYSGGSGLTVPTLKQKDLIGIPWMVAFALRADGWYLRSEIIWHKCLSGGTRLYARTQKGEGPHTLKDLVRLAPATVELWNGQRWTRVVRWTPVERPADVVELHLRSGERIGCTAEHRWPTQRGLVRSDEITLGDVIDTARLPEPEVPKTPSALPDDDIGWVAGLYMAEGSRGKGGGVLQFAGHEREVERFARLARIAAAFDGTCRQHHTGGHAVTVNVYSPALAGVIDAYIAGTGAKGKHLTARAYRRSDAFLRALLLGYLEGDGHEREPSFWVLGFTQNDAWAADLRTLCARLGLSPRLKRTVHTASGKQYPGWRGRIRFTRSGHHNERHDAEVMKIERSRTHRRHWDVEVADDPHTFALASGVLTHNSNPMPESVTDRPTKAHEQVFLLSKMPRYHYDADAIREAHSRAWWTESAGLGYMTARDGRKDGGKRQGAVESAGRNKRSVWTIATQRFSGGAHFATFPPKLIEPCILAGAPELACAECGAPWVRVVERTPSSVLSPNSRYDESSGRNPEGRNRSRLVGASVRTIGFNPSCDHDAPPVPGTVLDPFAGAGTTGLVALRHGRSFIGIELSAEYAALSRERIRDDSPLLNAHAETRAATHRRHQERH